MVGIDGQKRKETLLRLDKMKKVVDILMECIRNKGSRWGRYSSLIGLIVFWLLIDFSVRVWLAVYSTAAVSWSPWVLIKMFAVGFFYDLVIALQGLIPIALYLTFIPRKWFGKAWHRALLTGIIWFSSCLMLLGGISEFFFWQEFQNRFNFIAVDYLIYTTEVMGNIRESYPVLPLLGLIALVGAISTWLMSRYFLSWETEVNFKKRGSVLLLILLFPVIALFAVDGKYKNISTNSYNNQLAGNGLYELFSAFRNNELDYEKFYRTIPDAKAEADLRKLLETPNGKMISNEPWNFVRQVNGGGSERKPNIVFITVESLSSDYLGIYGNDKGLTPRLDALSKDSLWFSRVYATGTRTVRGLEALSLSIPPTPGQSIVRRPENQDLFTLGSVLRDHGYASHFLYGGYGYFDNMNDYFDKNGYKVTDRTDIPKGDIVMENVWGVADEVIFNQSIKTMDQDFAAGRPSFQMIMTTSNHRPFTYPDGRIDIPSPGDRAGAVKYTDWAIGNFIDQARTKPWFKDTIFVIVADHQADSAGKTEVPIQRYHIPLIIYGPDWIKAGKVDKLMSQIDVAPTLLGLLHFSYPSRFLGYDIMTLPKEKERIFISTYQSLAYGKGDKLVVLNPKQAVSFYQINYDTGEYTKLPEDPQLVEEAIAWYQGASKIYKDGLYRALTGQK